MPAHKYVTLEKGEAIYCKFVYPQVVSGGRLRVLVKLVVEDEQGREREVELESEESLTDERRAG